MHLRPVLVILSLFLCAVLPSVALAGQSEPKAIVLDDTEGIKTGAWITSTNYARSRIGKTYVHDNNANKGRLTITFTPEIPRDGEYEIALIFPPRPNCATNLPVRIVVVGLPGDSVYEQTRIVNESKADSNGCASLGKFYLPSGRKTSLTVSNKGTHGCVAVDGIQFRPLP